MKSVFLFAIMFQVFFLTNHTRAQNTFNVIIKDSLNDYNVLDAIELTNGGYILVACMDPQEKQGTKGVLIKIDKNGNLIKKIEVAYDEQPSGFSSICKFSELEFLLSGFIRSNGRTNIWLCVIDTSLEIRQSRSYDLGAFNNGMTHIISEQNGNFLCFGTITDTTSFQQDYAFIYQFSSLLDSLQFKAYDGHWGIGLDLIQRNDLKGYYLIGIGLANGGQAGKILTIDKSFNITRVTSLLPNIDNMSNIRYCDDKHLIATGERSYAWPSTEVRDIGVLKYDTMFNLIHSKAYGKKDTEDCPGWVKNIAVQSTNSIFIGGTGNLNFGALYANQPSWFMLNHTDTSLSLKWQKFYGGDGYYTLWGILPTRDSGCLMYGTFWDYQHISEYVNYISVIKVNKDGLLLGTDGQPSALLKDVILYPNPGNERIWAVTGRSDAWIEFLDLNGRKILGKSLSKGHTQIETSELSHGIYIYRVFDKKGLIQTGKWIKE